MAGDQVKLHEPFIITARLLPGLKLADAYLSLVEIKPGEEGRQRATFVLDMPGGVEYIDDSLQSGCGGFRNPVEAFESFLGFMGAAVEDHQYTQRTGQESENSDLFPPHVVEWAVHNHMELQCVHMDITNHEDGSPNLDLICAS